MVAGSRPTSAQCCGEHLQLAGDLVEAGREVGHLGVLGHEAQGLLLPLAADHDGGPTGRDRCGAVDGGLDPVVLALDRGELTAEHRPADDQGLLQALEALLHRREVDPEAFVLDVEPGGADAEERSSARDDVQRGDDLGEDGGVPVGHAGDQGAELHGVRAGRQRTEEGVGLEHLELRRAHHGQLVEVVHHHDGVGAGVLGGDGHGRHLLEEVARFRVRVGEVRDLQSDLDHAARMPGAGRGLLPGRVEGRPFGRPSGQCWRRYACWILISMSTPAGSSMRCSESTVLGDGSRMSSRRLWIRISKCSRLSLSL